MERVIVVASEDEGVGLDDGVVHPDTDKVHYVRVGAVPFGCKEAGKVMLGFLASMEVSPLTA